ncbi:dienelactone hydrolase family protein [Gandjariella thermophila]|uniref:Carboxymethylenebutenolidase n=1 Tax=Gandjariella thermophila TaxID=1931992 RepID=A0A4D4J4M2_9PSEU|nr:dienelactone hydrolase family protein [Gandjariella thermophila]GDY31625.1 carboxymethylenebutenolidase [Gandjariella thermophila]
MTEFERYVIEEHVEDFNDGLISRRELLRRVGLVTGSVAAAAALLETMGCGTRPTSTPPGPSSRASSVPRDFATPPAQPTRDGVTVREDDPRIRVTPLPVTGTDGAALISYHAAPAGRQPAGGILVVHENRGLVPHIKDVVRRVATAGFAALAVDLLSRDGGADRLSDPAAYAAALARRPVDAMVADLRQALGALSASGVGGSLGMTGFCFGGGMVWNALAAGVDVRAAVPFYGPAPSDIAGLARTRAAVFAVYAERDSRITASRDTVEAALKKTGRPYRIVVYPGVDHAFHNDTGPRYDATQAEAAWIAAVEWFRQYVPA